MTRNRAALGLVASIALSIAGNAPAVAQDPLSSIDWLSDSVTKPSAALPPLDGDVVSGAAPEAVSVTPLDAPDLNAVGLLTPAVTGLPRTLWAKSDVRDLKHLIAKQRANTVPAVQSLLYTLLLAELDAPRHETDDNSFLLARLDKLLELGALDQAQALLERAGPTQPELFRRWFDVALLTGHEDRACAAMLAAPGIAPTYSARIFCLARSQDWNAAVLTLESAKALGQVSPAEDRLLARFLELDESQQTLTIPSHPSPLVFRMYEAVGQPIATNGLPRAFVQTDLHFSSGWKAKIEATERLVAIGALPANQLLGIYTERRPAASGGVWDRVAALQNFDTALLGGNTDAIAKYLPRAWRRMQSVNLGSAFAKLYGARLMTLDLTGPAQDLAYQIGLLSERYETVAQQRPASNAQQRFLAGIAQGDLDGVSPRGALATALAPVFQHPAPALTPSQTSTISQGKLGEAALQAIWLITEGARGDYEDVAQGISLLRNLGLEDVARRAALEVMILGPRT